MNDAQPSTPTDLDALLQRQYGLARRDQLLAVGLTAQALSWRIRKGRWRRVLPGLYAAFPGRLDEFHRMVAACLHGGCRSQVTGVAALRWHGLRYVSSTDRIHLLIPHTSRRNSSGFVVIQRTARLDPSPLVRPAHQICSVSRAVADAARTCTEQHEVRAFVAEAVQRRLTTVRQLFDELDAGPVRHSALLRTALAEIADGVRSAPEAELRAVLSRSKILPTVLWNAPLATADGTRLPMPDGWIADVGLALEVDSREYHLSPEGWQRTMERHNVLARHGALVLHFTPSQIRRDPPSVLATVEQAYQERARMRADSASIRVRPRAESSHHRVYM